MTRKLAIAVVHGMGRQRKQHPDETGQLTYSARLHERLRAAVGTHRFDAEIAWREVFWADIVQKRQDEFEQAMRKVSSFGMLRSYAMHRLADAANYFPPREKRRSAYEAVHQRIDLTLADLDRDVPEGTPLLILAHSLGCHMMSNYIWDVTHGYRERPTPFQRFETLSGMLTFGCNIPIFTFSLEEVQPIAFPGNPARRSDPWWRNYYDRHDPLGFPLAPLSGGYEELCSRGELADYQVNVGWRLLQSWNPWCHNGYWHDRGFAQKAAWFVEELLDLPIAEAMERPQSDVSANMP
ncbi:hypothetical protein [Pseudoruegeria sp. HB172150]|uniref:hypothetical protein n=1 Tax=Pseudoruegeria sp. HB172150 TaxID=2721164 RepID=UPI001556A9A9|nr:hypothetical protein [Pseudoruegeria sp. HB172150]